MAKGMGTVDYQHKKLDLKPLSFVTAYLTVLGENSFLGCLAKDNICPSLLCARNPSATLKIWRHSKCRHQLHFRDFKCQPQAYTVFSSFQFLFQPMSFLFLKYFFPCFFFYLNKAVFFLLLSHN